MANYIFRERCAFSRQQVLLLAYHFYAESLKKLKDANIRTLMVTGDNLLTSLSVARESGMLLPSDTVLLATATPPSASNPATLTWGTSEDVPGSNPTSLT